MRGNNTQNVVDTPASKSRFKQMKMNFEQHLHSKKYVPVQKKTIPDIFYDVKPTTATKSMVRRGGAGRLYMALAIEFHAWV